VSLGRRDNGRPRSFTRTIAARSKAAAAAALADFVEEVTESSLPKSPELRDLTVDEAMERFLTEYLADEKGRDEKTISDYRHGEPCTIYRPPLCRHGGGSWRVGQEGNRPHERVMSSGEQTNAELSGPAGVRRKLTVLLLATSRNWDRCLRLTSRRAPDLAGRTRARDDLPSYPVSRSRSVGLG
jgi:hypothetical protein